MDLFQVLILSVVEGITEFLPVSSTGHLILFSHLLRIPQTDFVKSFEIFIQLGAILAVIFLYWKSILVTRDVIKKVLMAFLPTGILGFILYKPVKYLLLGNIIVTVTSLFTGGIALIVLERYFWKKEKNPSGIDNLSLKQSFYIGLFQSISMIPGVSRAAATIFGGLFMSLDRKTAVEFSFLLAVPTMLVATGYDLFKSSFGFDGYQWFLLGIGFIGAFITALYTIKYFLRYIQRHSFVSFGIYRIVLAIIFLALFSFNGKVYINQNSQVQVDSQQYQDINSDQLYTMLKNKDFYFVNVHIPYEGEIEKTDAFIPYDEIEKNFDKLPKDKNAKIVLYCRSGRMSAIAAKTLTGLGYTNVYNHILGMHDWQSKGYPLRTIR